MLFIIYNKETKKIINIIEAVKKDDITLSKNEAIFENKNIKDFSQTDIRAYNKDGSVKSLEQQLKEKIITLKDNEIIDNGIIRELNKNMEDDYILMIERRLEKLDKNKKIVEENGKKHIIEKSIEEKYKEGLITKEEYNAYIVSQRQGQYVTNIDGARAELLDSVLNNLASQGLLNETQMEALKKIQTTRANIKEQYPKQS
ncbi:phage tail protein [Brachyspira pilosicoli]|uniref:Phage tail protein n=1 Tax=Brachyspira pilosicoli TaxID=52584 RepID=A0AAJ6G7Y1_BRAPL|nr:phage tail protein [Brachyspira pilosicoli]WIH89337.1 phage tail protein [Brachyspira pilosicoli]WIH91632.1 phage tail protein [Brachyspira pilosicoli]WIH94556.1 phage tail protein [Brachyspira pilosicoli]